MAQRSSVTLSRFLVMFRLTINSFSASRISNTNAPIIQYPTTKDKRPIWDSRKLMTFRRNRQQLPHLVGGLWVGATEAEWPNGALAKLNPPAPTMDATVALLMSAASYSLMIIECGWLGIFNTVCFGMFMKNPCHQLWLDIEHMINKGWFTNIRRLLQHYMLIVT